MDAWLVVHPQCQSALQLSGLALLAFMYLASEVAFYVTALILLLVNFMAVTTKQHRGSCCLLPLSLCAAACIAVPPVAIRVAFWNNGWDYDFKVLESSSPDCDLDALVQELVRGFSFGNETPHWDAAAGRCDCRLPAEGAEGHCRRLPEAEDLPTFVMVSALVNLGRRSRSSCDYLRYSFPHWMRDVDVVVFGEAWALDFVRKVREHAGLMNRTTLHVLTSADEGGWFHFLHLLPQMQVLARKNYLRHMALHNFRGGVAPKSVPAYDWVLHEKVSFLLAATEEVGQGIERGQKYFVWMDAGAGHGEIQLPQHLCGCNLAVPGTVTLFHRDQDEESLFHDGCGVLPLDHIHLKPFLKYQVWDVELTCIMGTFFGGDKEGIRWLFQEYNRTVYAFLEGGHIDADQGILALIATQRDPHTRFMASNFFGVADIC